MIAIRNRRMSHGSNPMLDWMPTGKGRLPLADSHYYLARSIQEQVAAERAASEDARNAHDELAMLYRFKAAMLSSGPDCWSEALAPRSPETA